MLQHPPSLLIGQLRCLILETDAVQNQVIVYRPPRNEEVAITLVNVPSAPYHQEHVEYWRSTSTNAGADGPVKQGPIPTRRRLVQLTELNTENGGGNLQ